MKLMRIFLTRFIVGITLITSCASAQRTVVNFTGIAWNNETDIEINGHPIEHGQTTISGIISYDSIPFQFSESFDQADITGGHYNAKGYFQFANAIGNLTIHSLAGELSYVTTGSASILIYDDNETRVFDLDTSTSTLIRVDDKIFISLSGLDSDGNDSFISMFIVKGVDSFTGASLSAGYDFIKSDLPDTFSDAGMIASTDGIVLSSILDHISMTIPEPGSFSIATGISALVAVILNRRRARSDVR